MLAVFFLPLITFLFYFNVATFSFAKLGLSPEGAVALFGLSLIGSMINIPVSRKRFLVEESPIKWFPFIFYYPPRVREQVIAVNLGGAIIPSLFALYLLPRAPLLPAVISTVVVTWVAKMLARPVPGVGIAMPAFVPPLVAAGVALILAPGMAAPVAYIAGVLGTLIGADLLNLHRLENLGAHAVSIGGAGIYDGIFLVGVVAAILS